MSASTPAGAVLEFKLLGPPAIELDGRPLRFARKKTAALLFYLAGTARPLPRDKAAALLWPEYAPDHARANLRGAMLDAERAAGTSLFPVGADPVGFVAGLELRVDAAVFESRVREALGDGGLCKESGIEEALALYRGGFLEGFFLKDAYEFEEWQLLREAHYRNLAVRGLAARGRLLLETGRFEEADVKARAIIAIAPLDEMGHALLSEILAACGDAEGARAQYHLFADLLDRELGSEPSPSYAALCESIQNRRFKPASRQKRLLRASLPSWADSFIGRAADLERIAAALESSRFATIAGPGGSGKTRLAVEAAAVLVPGFRGGACFLDFSACGREELMAAAARGLGLPPISRETPAGLASRLGNAEMLIIMDNCERVAGECAALASALAGVCPGVKLLATSIQPLGAPGESVFFIDTLPVPGPYDLAETIMQSPAVTLFVDRMRGPHARVWNVEDSQALGLIARRLGGLPLAIELAAARARAYPLKALAQTLADALDLEAGYGQRLPDRQRTLERVIAWSWALLNAEERRCAEILSVFESGFDAEAFEAVLGCPAMAVVPQLADKSIVVPDARGLWPPRWRFLEPVRTYAGARLSASDAATAAFPAHAAYYLGLAERIGAGLSPARGTGALAALMTEWPNIAAACRYSMSREHRASALRALMELRRFFLVEDRIADLEPLIAAVDPCSLSGAEERAAYEELSSLCSWFDLDLDSLRERSREASRSWLAAGNETAARRSELIALAFGTMSEKDIHLAADRIEESACFFLNEGNRVLASEAWTRACARLALHDRVDPERAFAALDKAAALARELDDIILRAECAWFSGLKAQWLGDGTLLNESVSELIAIDRELDSPLMLADAMRLLSDWRYEQGDYEGALQAAGESRQRYGMLGHRMLSLQRRIIESECLTALGRPDEAMALLSEGAREAGESILGATLSYRLALQLASAGRLAEAFAELENARAATAPGSPNRVRFTFFLARLSLSAGEDGAAEKGFLEVEPILRGGGFEDYIQPLDRYLAFLRAPHGPEGAVSFIREALKSGVMTSNPFETAWLLAILSRALAAKGVLPPALRAARIADAYAQTLTNTFNYPERAVFSRLVASVQAGFQETYQTKPLPGPTDGNKAYEASLLEELKALLTRFPSVPG